MQLNNVEEALDAIRDVLKAEIDAAYDRGRADAKAEIMALLSSDAAANDRKAENFYRMRVDRDTDDTIEQDTHDVIESEEPEVDQHRKRAPRGLPKALTDRVLSAYGREGCTPADILEHAETDYEKMIKPTSIRAVLRKGEQEGHYIERNGIWFLAGADNDRLDDLLS